MCRPPNAPPNKEIAATLAGVEMVTDLEHSCSTTLRKTSFPGEEDPAAAQTGAAPINNAENTATAANADDSTEDDNSVDTNNKVIM